MKGMFNFGGAMASLALQFAHLSEQSVIPKGPGHGTGKTRSAANIRADRLVMKRRAWWGSYLPETEARYTRQARRKEDRAMAKEQRHLRKAHAMQTSVLGGAATIL